MKKLIITLSILLGVGFISGAGYAITRHPNHPVTLGVETTPTVTPTPMKFIPGACASNVNDKDIIRLTNEQRASNGLKYLVEDPRLDQSAAMKANDEITNNYWAHVSPSGVQPWYWFARVKYYYTYAGENLAMNFDTSDGVMMGWMNSLGHRANILNPNYEDIGVAHVCGMLLGKRTTLVVAHYGS